MTPSPASPDAKGLSNERATITAFVEYGPLRSYDQEKIMARVLGDSLVSAEEVRDQRGLLKGWNITLSARERAEPAAWRWRESSGDKWIVQGSSVMPEGVAYEPLYAASPPVAVRATADMVKRARECLANAKVTGENPTSQRALEYRLGELLDALDTPASSVVDEGMGQPVRDLIGAAKRVYDKLASETASVNILDQEALGVALAALTKGDRP